MFLDIHLEYCDDKGKKLRILLEAGKPFSISVVPVLLLPKHEVYRKGIYPFDYYYPKEIVKILKKCAQNPQIIFGQQGLTHYCPDCFKRKEERGSHHENMCLYNPTKTVEEQKKFMQEGKKIIEKTLDVSPILYIPPNHQFDNNSKIAAKELGFKFFGIKKELDNLFPYKERKLIILPERAFGEKGEIIYTHYDKMTNNFNEFLKIVQKSNSLDDIVPVKHPAELISKNEEQIILKKKKIGIFGREREVKLKRLIEIEKKS